MIEITPEMKRVAFESGFFDGIRDGKTYTYHIGNPLRKIHLRGQVTEALNPLEQLRVDGYRAGHDAQLQNVLNNDEMIPCQCLAKYQRGGYDTYTSNVENYGLTIHYVSW